MSRRACFCLVLMAGLVAGTDVHLQAQKRPPMEPRSPAAPAVIEPVREPQGPLPKRVQFPEEDENRTRQPTAQHVDLAHARREAAELAALAVKIPSQVEELSQKTLPHDLIQQLRRIEELAKRLRKEISR